MKKLVLFVAAAVAVAFASCGGSAQTQEAEVDEVEVIDESPAVAEGDEAVEVEEIVVEEAASEAAAE